MPLSLKEPVDVFYQSLEGSTRKNFKQFSDAMGQEYNPPEKYIYEKIWVILTQTRREGIGQVRESVREACLRSRYWSRYIEEPIHQ